MNVLLCGDVMGRSGREMITSQVPNLIDKYNIELTVVNGENAAGGFGILPDHCKELFGAGTDVITTGNHVWRQKEIASYIANEPRLLRPYNYSNKETPGKGMAIAQTRSGKRVLVVNIMCQLFMNQIVDSPMYAMQSILDKYKIGNNIDGIIVDLHGEATSEKMAFAQMFDGQISAVVGTHTHIPTADYRILNNGTAFQSDLGMCGDFDSVIGMDKKVPIANFLGKVNAGRMEAATGPGTLCGLLVELGDNGLATAVNPVRIGANLSNTLPTV